MNNADQLPQNKSANIIIALSIILYIGLFSFLSLWKYFNFYYNALDLAIINQVFFNSSLGNFFASSIHPPTYLGDHFTPILFLLLPFYWLRSGPETLLILQSIVLGLSAWPIYLIAKNVLSKNLAILISIVWLLNPIVQNINLFEWHFLPFAIFFILWSFYFWQQNKIIPFTIFSILALLVREDVSLVIFMFGIIGIINKKNIKLILLPIFLSITYFIFSIFITNSLAPGDGYKFFIYYTSLGSTPLEAIKNIALKPWLIISQILRPNNFIYAVGLLLPLVFIPALGATYLLLGLIIFVQLSLGGGGGSTALLETHYSSLLLPALFIAFIYGFKKIINPDNTDKINILLNSYKTLVKIIIVIGIIYTSVIMGPLPGVIKTLLAQGIKPSNSTNLEQMLSTIPPNAIVASSYKTLANLSSRSNLYSFNYAWLGKQQFLSYDYPLPEDTEFIVFDFKDLITYQLQYGDNNFYSKQYNIAKTAWPKILEGFGLIDIQGSVGLYQKNKTNKINLVDSVASQKITNKKNTIINEEIIFLGYNLAQNDNPLELFWQVKQPLQKTYRLKLIAEKNGKRLAESTYPFAYDLLKPEVPGTKKIQTNYWLEFNRNLPDKYNLQFQILTIEGGEIEINGIRSTQNIVDKSYVSEIFTLE